jgi:hypothetical protein
MLVKEKSSLKKSGKPIRKKRIAEKTEYQTLFNQEWNTQFHKLLDAFPVAVVMVGLNGSTQFMNRKAKALLGEPDPALKLEDWTERFGFYLDDGIVPYPGQKLNLLRVLQGETLEEPEEIILKKEVEERATWIAISAQAIKDADGNIEGAVALIRDITHRKQIELSREKHMERIDALYRLSRMIIEAGNNLNDVTHLGAKFASEVIGDISVVTLLTELKDKYRIAAFHDQGPDGQVLLRKSLLPDAEYDLSDGPVGGVINSGEPLLIPSIAPEQLHKVSSSAFRNLIKEISIESMLIVPLIGRSGILRSRTAACSNHCALKFRNVCLQKRSLS